MALARLVQCSNDVLDGALAVDGISQNRGKEELLMRLVGAGSVADRGGVRKGQVQLPGKVVTVARHLGSHLGEKASFAREVPRRRHAMMTAFFSVEQLCYESRVSWRLKWYTTIVKITKPKCMYVSVCAQVIRCDRPWSRRQRDIGVYIVFCCWRTPTRERKTTWRASTKILRNSRTRSPCYVFEMAQRR